MRVWPRWSGRFERAGVRSILLKGPAVARWLYGPGEPRRYSDIDLLVGEADLAAAGRSARAGSGLRHVAEPDPLLLLIAVTGCGARRAMGSWSSCTGRWSTIGAPGVAGVERTDREDRADRGGGCRGGGSFDAGPHDAPGSARRPAWSRGPAAGGSGARNRSARTSRCGSRRAIWPCGWMDLAVRCRAAGMPAGTGSWPIAWVYRRLRSTGRCAAARRRPPGGCGICATLPTGVIAGGCWWFLPQTRRMLARAGGRRPPVT